METSTYQFEQSLSQAVAATEPAQTNPVTQPVAQPQADTPKADVTPKPESANPWENLPDVPEPSAEPDNTPEPQPDPTEPAEAKAKTPWRQLRETETQYKKILPEYESLKKEVAELRTKQSSVPEEVQKEIQELRDFQTAYSVKQTPEWKSNIEAPIQHQYDRLSVVAKDMGVDLNSLIDATNETNSYARNKAIKKLIEDSTSGFEQSAYTEAVEASAEANSIYQKAAELQRKSAEIKTAYEGKKTFEQTQQQEQQQQRLADSSKAMADRFKASLKSTDLLNDDAFVGEVMGVRPADPSSEPEMAVYQAQAGKLMPKVISRLHAVTKELAEAKRVLAERSKASAPAPNGNTPSAPVVEEFQDRLNQAVRSGIPVR